MLFDVRCVLFIPCCYVVCGTLFVFLIGVVVVEDVVDDVSVDAVVIVVGVVVVSRGCCRC